MDRLLLLGLENPKLMAFLKKMGYQILREDEQATLISICVEAAVDLILVDSSNEVDGAEICKFIKSSTESKGLPIVFISGKPREIQELQRLGYKGIEFMEAPASPGLVVSKIATSLRLKKMAGADEDAATLSEINLRLRDLHQRFMKELEEARTIQQSLIPAVVPVSDKLDIAVSYTPLEQVGGDWYYVAETDSGALSVQIADVTGHGLSAAFIGAMTKLAKIAVASDSPAKLLKDMNRLLATSIPEGKFITFYSYLLDPVKRTLQYARAGHPPALLYRASEKRVEQLMGDGFALGFFENSVYEPLETMVDSGDLIVVFTDGYPEAQNRAAEVYGYKRMEKILCQQHDNSAQVVLDSLSKDFKKFLGGRLLKDDITLIVVKVK